MAVTAKTKSKNRSRSCRTKNTNYILTLSTLDYKKLVKVISGYSLTPSLKEGKQGQTSECISNMKGLLIKKHLLFERTPLIREEAR